MPDIANLSFYMDRSGQSIFAHSKFKGYMIADGFVFQYIKRLGIGDAAYQYLFVVGLFVIHDLT